MPKAGVPCAHTASRVCGTQTFGTEVPGDRAKCSSSEQEKGTCQCRKKSTTVPQEDFTRHKTIIKAPDRTNMPVEAQEQQSRQGAGPHTKRRPHLCQELQPCSRM